MTTPVHEFDMGRQRLCVLIQAEHKGQQGLLKQGNRRSPVFDPRHRPYICTPKLQPGSPDGRTSPEI